MRCDQPFKDWRYQGRFDNDVLMSKGVLCANDHKVAWALGGQAHHQDLIFIEL